jgi:cytochrome c
MRPARLAILVLATLTTGCGAKESPRPELVASGDAGRGRIALQQFDCGVCHVIPGINGAQSHVGPSLAQYARRVYLAGKFPNEEPWLVRWIMDPPALAPRTAMPAVGVDARTAQDMAAYLFTLR